MAAKRRRCKGKTKAGKACKAAPLKGGDFCLAHDEVARAKTSFGSAEAGAKGGEARRVPKLTEILRERVEERAEEIIDKLFAGLGAQRAVVVGTGPQARLEIVEDPDQVLKTIREIYDRFEGKPRQVQEISGPGGEPLGIVPVSREKAERAGLLAAAVGGG